MTMIVIAGIPGTGKSSTAKALSKSIGATVFLEPEEKEWPEIVKNRETYGLFTGITWFRGVRVKQLFDADEINKKGENVLLDTYYDKLIHLYLGKPGLNWLISPDDPYFKATQEMSKTDYESLPNADIVVGLKISDTVWEQFIESRGRDLDKLESFKKECFQLQTHLLNAAQQYCLDFGKKYVEINQEFGSPEKTALIIKKESFQQKLINYPLLNISSEREI